MESNDSPEIPDRGETLDIPGLLRGTIAEAVSGKTREFLKLSGLQAMGVCVCVCVRVCACVCV